MSSMRCNVTGSERPPQMALSFLKLANNCSQSSRVPSEDCTQQQTKSYYQQLYHTIQTTQSNLPQTNAVNRFPNLLIHNKYMLVKYILLIYDANFVTVYSAITYSEVIQPVMAEGHQ